MECLLLIGEKRNFFQERYKGKEGINKGKVTDSVGRKRGDPGKMHKTEGPDLTK